MQQDKVALPVPTRHGCLSLTSGELRTWCQFTANPFNILSLTSLLLRLLSWMTGFLGVDTDVLRGGNFGRNALHSSYMACSEALVSF